MAGPRATMNCFWRCPLDRPHPPRADGELNAMPPPEQESRKLRVDRVEKRKAEGAATLPGSADLGSPFYFLFSTLYFWLLGSQKSASASRR
jgi:hypothetical protein